MKFYLAPPPQMRVAPQMPPPPNSETWCRHCVCIMFLPNPPIAIAELLNGLSHEWLTFLLVIYRQEYTVGTWRYEGSFLRKPEQQHR